MSVKIRLKRTGTTKKAHWRVVVTDSKNPREGRFIEEIGYYQPGKTPAHVSIKLDRYKNIFTHAQTDNTRKLANYFRSFFAFILNNIL